LDQKQLEKKGICIVTQTFIHCPTALPDNNNPNHKIPKPVKKNGNRIRKWM